VALARARGEDEGDELLGGVTGVVLPTGLIDESEDVWLCGSSNYT
jgi:hypothetical protein